MPGLRASQVRVRALASHLTRPEFRGQFVHNCKPLGVERGCSQGSPFLPETTTPDQWRDDSLRTRRAAFDAAVSYADRLTLLRELVRLQDGRLSLAEADVRLTEAEDAALARFGLSRTGDGSVLKSMDLDHPRLGGLSAMITSDPSNRRLFGAAAPDAVLLRLSGHTAYQSPTQKAAVRAVLTMPPSGALMVSMPTGSGKSLLFQLAPRYWRETAPGACVVVITPTVALAEDHERTLGKIPGLDTSRALTGAVKGAARDQILLDFRNGLIPVLFLAPEAALQGAVRDALEEAALPPEKKFGLQARLEAIFVDEAHIVEQWGRSFRPDFQRLPALVSELRRANPALRVVLLSATLGPAARHELRRAYGTGSWLEIHARSPRYEIDLQSLAYENADERNEDLLWLIDHLPRPAIVYTTRVNDASALHDTLLKRGYRRLALFTGEVTDGGERRRIINQWADNALDLVVATSAFGLGVDKSDVRAVVHACLPENASRWYQEIGRASRDGREGLGLTLWTTGAKGDERDAFNFSAGSWLTQDLGRKRWIALRDSAKAEWVGPVRRLALDLDSAHDGLGRWTGAQNRRWNLSLLNLMQRAGALMVSLLTDPDDGPVRCEVDLHWPSLLEDSAQALAELDRVFSLRDAEQIVSIAEFNAFRALMAGKHPDACLLAGAFLQIEPDVPFVEPCGRCGPCRTLGVPVPTRAGADGVDCTWPPFHIDGPTRRVLIDAARPDFRSGLDRLIRRLVGVGVDQFLVPERISDDVARIALQSSADFGFVLPVEEWLDDRWRVAAGRTALFCPDEDDRLVQAIHALDDLPDAGVVYVVGNPRRLLGGRPLSQHFLLAYEEAALEGDGVTYLDLAKVGPS